MARKKTAREKADEKRRFYMYLSYGRQMEMLTDEELGRTMRHVYHYADTRELRDDKSPLVNMLVSVITTQYDIDKENYVEMIEQNRENASKGGEKSAEIRRAKAEQARPEAQTGEDDEKEDEEVSFAEAEYVSFNEAVVQTGTIASKNEPRLKNEPDREIDRETDSLIDRKTEETLCSSNNSCSRSAGEGDEHALIFYGANQRPTTRAELRRNEELTRELYSTYMPGKPTRYDYECIFEHVHERTVNADGEAYAAYSPAKADLLRYVFRVAAEQQKLGWYYMDGILKKCEENGVKTAEEAIQQEYRWKRGELA